MKKKVSDFMNELRKEREGTNSSLGNNLDEPLLDVQAEGGSPPRGSKLLVDYATGAISTGPVEGFGLPEKISLPENELKASIDR